MGNVLEPAENLEIVTFFEFVVLVKILTPFFSEFDLPLLRQRYGNECDPRNDFSYCNYWQLLLEAGLHIEWACRLTMIYLVGLCNIDSPINGFATQNAAAGTVEFIYQRDLL